MEIRALAIPAVKLIVPKVIGDERGYFMESFRESALKDVGIDDNFVQDNQSLSGKGILRGLHFQVPPFAQSKLVRVVSGAVLDVAVDLRKSSPTYGQYVAELLDTENMHQLYVPKGFAHGFLTLEENTIFQYKCGGYYNKESELGLQWNDPEIGIDWRIDNPKLSAKDQDNLLLKDFSSPWI